MSPILGIWASSQQGGISNTAFESIATVTVGAGGTSAVTFSSIPSTYTHLQVRAFGKDASIYGAIFMRLNNDTASNYSRRGVYGDGSSVAAFGATSAPYMNVVTTPASSGGFGAAVIDILDYASTSKNKTIRSLSGYDNNGSGIAVLYSGCWFNNTTAVSRIDIISDSTIGQYSSFALYGIKGGA